MSEDIDGAEMAILDMLGDKLKSAVIEARSRTGDATIMARVSAGAVLVERGAPLKHTAPMTDDDAVTHLSALV